MFTRILDQVVRVVVGGLFIFSGLIKLNDPIGTAIKMEEYFEVFVHDFGSFFKIFIPISLPIAFLLIVIEIVLGIALLIGYRMKFTSIALLVIIVFFTFLTFYSAAFDKVTDCGCFGDAIKLTPWESFTKDVVLLVLILHLVWHRKRYTSLLPEKIAAIAVIASTVICIVIGVYAIQHLPFIDFRPYKVGNYIPEQMQPEEAPELEYTFVYNGKEVTSAEFIMEEGYEYKSSRVVNPDKSTPKITDYRVSTIEGDDVTQQTFEGRKLFIIIANVDKISVSNIDAIRTLVNGLEGKVDVMALTSSDAASFDAFRHAHQLPVNYYFADATVLKTIIRSNPGITFWINGIVAGKWHHNDTPDPQEILDYIR